MRVVQAIVPMVPVLLGVAACGGECEFVVTPRVEGCDGACATIDSEEIPEASICAAFDCILPDQGCADGFRCVALSGAVCLPACDDDDDCPFGLSCEVRPDAVTNDSVGVCFYPE